MRSFGIIVMIVALAGLQALDSAPLRAHDGEHWPPAWQCDVVEDQLAIDGLQVLFCRSLWGQSRKLGCTRNQLMWHDDLYFNTTDDLPQCTIIVDVAGKPSTRIPDEWDGFRWAPVDGLRVNPAIPPAEWPSYEPWPPLGR